MGFGCIVILLVNNLFNVEVFVIDIFEEVLKVVLENILYNKVVVNFI